MNPTDAPACHICGAPPLYQWRRRATPEESAQRRTEVSLLQGRVLTDVEIEQRYGPAVTAVTGCAVHHLAPEPGDGTPGAAAAAEQAGTDRRALLHDVDCGGHGGCVCDPAVEVGEP